MTHQDSTESVGALRTMWRYKWFIVTPFALMLAATMAWSHYYLPVRYRSQAAILIVPARVPVDFATPPQSVSQRLPALSQVVLSRTRLERLIDEFHVYEGEGEPQPIEQVVERFRRDVEVALRSDDQGGAGFTLSFTSSRPETAMRVTQRLAAMIIEENLRDNEVRSEGSVQFVQARIEEVRKKVNATEAQIAAQTKGGKQPARADMIEYEVLQETLRSLLVRLQELSNITAVERRQIGEQFKILDAARVPKTPVGPDRLTVNAAGGAVGLGIGLLLAWVRRPRNAR